MYRVGDLNKIRLLSKSAVHLEAYDSRAAEVVSIVPPGLG